MYLIRPTSLLSQPVVADDELELGLSRGQSDN
jgi:hypothetical protein